MWFAVMEYEFKELFNRLNKVCREAYNSAVHSCQTKKHYSIEIEDVLLRILDRTDTDIYQILRYYELDRQSLIRQLEATVAARKRAPDASPIVSPQVYDMLSQAWLISSLMLKEGQIRSGSIMLALINSDSFRGLLLEKCTLFLRIPRQVLKHELSDIIRTSEEKCLTPAHLQVVASNSPALQEPAQQPKPKQFEDKVKTFTPKPDEVAHEDYKGLCGKIHDITNQKSLNNILLIDTPDLEFDSFLASMVHNINLLHPDSCEVKLLRLASKPKYRRDTILSDLAKSTIDSSKAYLYAIDTSDFSEHVFDTLKNVCYSNKVRFIFHDSLAHTANSLWLNNYLVPVLHKFEDVAAIKKRFLAKIKHYESQHKISLNDDAAHWLYTLAAQYSKGSAWHVGEKLLQEITQLNDDNKDSSGNVKSRAITKDDIFKIARISLNKFVDFSQLEKNNANSVASSIHKEFNNALLKTIVKKSGSSDNNPMLSLLSGGSHTQRFHNAEKAALMLSFGHQRVAVISQTDNYKDCSQAIVETMMRYKTPHLFIDFDTATPGVLISLIQDIEAGYINHGGMNFPLRSSSFYFSTNYSRANAKQNSNSRELSSVSDIIKQYAGPWVNQNLREYDFDETKSSEQKKDSHQQTA